MTMAEAAESKTQSIYSFSAKTIDGREISLETYRGKVVLIVNVASQCGFTSQYKGLESLWKKFKDRGLVVLGFPCNQFGEQEPGKEEDIKKFCQLNFGVSFPLFSKINVNGKKAHPLYQYLKEANPGVMGTKAIKWNFTKFLIDQNGIPVKRYGSAKRPKDLTMDIEKLLGHQPAKP